MVGHTVVLESLGSVFNHDHTWNHVESLWRCGDVSEKSSELWVWGRIMLTELEVSIPKKQHLPNSHLQHLLTHLDWKPTCTPPGKRNCPAVSCVFEAELCAMHVKKWRDEKPVSQAALGASHPHGKWHADYDDNEDEAPRRVCKGNAWSLQDCLSTWDHPSYQKLQSCRVCGSTQSNSTKASTTLSAQVWLARNQ